MSDLVIIGTGIILLGFLVVIMAMVMSGRPSSTAATTTPGAGASTGARGAAG